MFWLWKPLVRHDTLLKPYQSQSQKEESWTTSACLQQYTWMNHNGKYPWEARVTAHSKTTPTHGTYKTNTKSHAAILFCSCPRPPTRWYYSHFRKDSKLYSYLTARDSPQNYTTYYLSPKDSFNVWLLRWLLSLVAWQDLTSWPNTLKTHHLYCLI